MRCMAAGRTALAAGASAVRMPCTEPRTLSERVWRSCSHGRGRGLPAPTCMAPARAHAAGASAMPVIPCRTGVWHDSACGRYKKTRSSRCCVAPAWAARCTSAPCVYMRAHVWHASHLCAHTGTALHCQRPALPTTTTVVRQLTSRALLCSLVCGAQVGGSGPCPAPSQGLLGGHAAGGARVSAAPGARMSAAPAPGLAAAALAAQPLPPAACAAQRCLRPCRAMSPGSCRCSAPGRLAWTAAGGAARAAWQY